MIIIISCLAFAVAVKPYEVCTQGLYFCFIGMKIDLIFEFKSKKCALLIKNIHVGLEQYLI